MRNLNLSDFQSRRLKNLGDCETFCYYLECLYAYDKGTVIKCQASGEEEIICNLTEKLYPVTELDDIPKALDISYCCEHNSLYLILLNGDIISIDVNGGGLESIVGSVESGIEACQWSPEQEVIALVTGNKTVLVMTNDFEPISEVNLHGGGFGEKQFITVGWGKKETQFRGSEGKFNAKEKNKTDSSVSLEKNDRIKISWRGDAEYFAVSSINPDTSQRYLRIFSKNGVLHYTSENLNGLEHCLDWRPSGNLIASTQILPNKYNVCFFEKNGLKHGEFTLPLGHQEIRVEDVLWNKDSRILALLITKVSGSVNDNNIHDKQINVKYIQLYTVSNYHWYCKHTINFDYSTEPLFMQWSCQKFNILYVMVKRKGQIFLNKYSWMWTINKSKGNSVEDESFVAVIDGCNIRITSFKKGIMPPPMSTYVIQLPVPVNSVSFAPDIGNCLVSSNDFIVLLSDGSLLGYKFVDKGSKVINHELLFSISGLFKDLEAGFNFQWVSSKTFMFCLVKTEEKESKPYLTMVNVNSFEKLDISYEKKEIPLESSIAILRASENGIVFYDNDGVLYSFDINTEESVILDSNRKTIIDLEIKDKDDSDFNVFALDNLNKFYINHKIAFNSVLSFHVHEKFVLITTMKHELLCLNIETDLKDKIDLSEMPARRVERGSRIVTSVHKDMKVILQMPRGNLECIQPRALSIFVLGKYLNSLNYYEAFDLMRKQRINLNLIYDHDPDLFSKNIDMFIDQIKDLQWISLFLSDLSDEDVTKTMYSALYRNKVNENDNHEGKIETVCHKVEKALTQKENSEKYLLPILTCFIKRGKIEFLETVLLKLKELKEKEQKGIKSVVSFDEAFRYILYLIDVDELYKIALGMYDFDAVVMVASKSQKDPKEYLSFLNDLNKLNPNYLKFKIDKYLKRFEKALTNLILCDGDEVFDECLHFIKAHNLYKSALKLIPENTDKYKKVCVCYGDELMKSHSYEEAGIVYSNAGAYKDAMNAYRKSGNWEEALSCGRALKLSEDELNEFYLDLAMELSEQKYFKEAAVIYLDYLKDFEEGLRTLCKGKYFAEAYRISSLHNRPDLHGIIATATLEQGQVMELQIATFGETFKKQKNRLQVVRKQKAEASESKGEFEDDIYSETNTIITQSNATSRNTNRTYRSAKNRRKQERKLLSLKEGSQYEDLALITSLYNIVTNCIQLKSEVRELNKFLIKIKQYELAEKLQKELEELLRSIEHSKSDIWTPDLLNNRHSYGPQATSNEISAMYMNSENITPSLLNPKFAIPPETQNNMKWQLELLKP